MGILLTAALRLAVYVKGRNAKKIRKNVEYGSARWGKAKDIRPAFYIQGGREHEHQ